MEVIYVIKVNAMQWLACIAACGLLGLQSLLCLGGIQASDFNQRAAGSLTLDGVSVSGEVRDNESQSFAFVTTKKKQVQLWTTGSTQVTLSVVDSSGQSVNLHLAPPIDHVNQKVFGELPPGRYQAVVRHRFPNAVGEFTLHGLAASPESEEDVDLHQKPNFDEEPTVLPQIDTSRKSKKLALLVGINEYQVEQDLSGCVNDVEDMKDLLTSHFDFQADDILVLLNDQATHENIVQAFQQHLIERAENGAITLFHFSGHGSQMLDEAGGDEQSDHLDETIVPHDSRTPGKYDIRDDELNGLFSQLVAKECLPTFILDSCHSGTGTKNGFEPGVARKVDTDTRPAPPAAPWEVSTKGSETKDSRLENLNYVLIAGCQNKEVSYELNLNGISRGALTYSLTKAIRDAGTSAVTYDQIMNEVKSEVQKYYPTQNPQIEGKLLNNFVFSDKSNGPPGYVPVKKEEGKLYVPAGLAHGITKGTWFDIYPKGTEKADLDDLTKGTVAFVTQVEAFRSVVEPKSDSNTQIKDGAYAVLRELALPNTAFHVGFLTPEIAENYLSEFDGTISPLAPGSPLAIVKQTLATSNEVAVVSEPPAGLWFGKVDGKYRVYRPGGLEVRTAEAGINRDELQEWVVSTIKHWGRYEQNLAINNRSNQSFGVELSVEGAKFDRSETDRVPLPTFREGDDLRFKVENQGQAPFYFSIIEFEENGEVSVIWPENGGDGEKLPAGVSVLIPSDGEPFTAAFPDSIPADRKTIVSRYKVIATADQSRFDILEMDAQKGVTRSKARKWATSDIAVKFERED